jgi:putative membrane protein
VSQHIPTGGPPSVTQYQGETSLTDGEWHRLHPATPLLRGGIFLIAVLGIVISNLRERIIDFFVGAPTDIRGDPIDAIYDRGLTGWALLAVALALLIAIGAFYLSWRMHSFRIADDAVEVRSGIVFRSFRKARLDRIQGINVQRPVLARLFGAARLEIVVAGHDANVHLAYLAGSRAEDVRREILRLASGAQRAERIEQAQEQAQEAQLAAGAPTSGPGAAMAAARLAAVVNSRLDEFVTPADLSTDGAPPHSIVKMSPVRLAGSLILSGFTIVLLAILALIIWVASTGRLFVLFALLPGVLGALSFYTRRFSKSLRYTISGSRDGVRVGFGLIATSSETIPPGRIHAVEITQPLMWRPFGWWQLRINTAGHSRQRGADGDKNTTILPVGSAQDVQNVLPLLLPGLNEEARTAIARAGMDRKADQSPFSVAPARARWIRPFSWRRTGYTIVDGVVVLRHGAIWRRIMFVPLARMQSVEIEQGPVHRWLSLASAHVHTVEGPVRPHLGVIGIDESRELFDTVSAAAIEFATRDTSHHWNAVGQERQPKPFPSTAPPFQQPGEAAS